jgi:hypothetical protein
VKRWSQFVGLSLAVITYVSGAGQGAIAAEAGAVGHAASSSGQFPTVDGTYFMTADWSISLRGAFKRRFEDDSLVLWRSGVTAWIIVWNKSAKETKADRLATLRKDVSTGAFGVRQEVSDGLLRFSYRLREEGGDTRAPGFYSFVVGECGHVQMAVYFDDERDVEVARTLWRGLRELRRPTGRCSGRGPRLRSEPRR